METRLNYNPSAQSGPRGVCVCVVTIERELRLLTRVTLTGCGCQAGGQGVT